MSRLRSYGRMAKQSPKVKRGEADFRAVYAEVDQRSEGRCEFWIPLESMGLQSSPVIRLRCRKGAVDHHHVLKPRRSHHHPSAIVHLCREHHERADFPFKRGRLVIGAGSGVGEFTFSIQYASDKFAARGQG